MKQPSRTLATVLLALAGAGIGAILAEQQGVSSWLDAKLYLSLGAAAGVFVAALLLHVSAKKD